MWLWIVENVQSIIEAKSFLLSNKHVVFLMVSYKQKEENFITKLTTLQGLNQTL